MGMHVSSTQPVFFLNENTQPVLLEIPHAADCSTSPSLLLTVKEVLELNFFEFKKVLLISSVLLFEVLIHA